MIISKDLGFRILIEISHELIQTSLAHKRLRTIRRFAPNFFFFPPSFFFDQRASKARHWSIYGISEGCQTSTLYANFVYYLAGSTVSALVRGCRSPQQLPSKVYARGFLISSLRAAVRATVFTTAAGKLSTNLEGSICCP